MQIFARDEIVSRPVEVNSRILYNDIYRKRVNDLPALTWNGMAEEVAGFLPYKRGGMTTGFQAVLSSHQGRFQNTEDRTAVAVVNDAAGYGISLGVTFQNGRRIIGGSLAGSRTRNNTAVEFKAFPSAESVAMNRYFLDWLEPTFGREWDIGNTSSGFNPQVVTDVPLSNERRLSLLFSHMHRSYQPRVRYTNSSNKAELTGERLIDFMLRFDENLVAARLNNETRGSSWMAVFFDSPLTFDTDNHSPPTEPVNLDHYTLGDGRFRRRGLNIQLLKNTGTSKFELGIGTCRYTGRLRLNTPVLGYFAGLLPISHGVAVKIEGSSFSQRIKANYSPVIFGIQSSLLAGYSHGYYDLFVDGEAQLEFNLISVPINHPIQFHLHLVEFGAGLTFRRGPVSSAYSFAQLIPFITRVDESPMKFHEKVPDVSLQSRGGAVHQLTFSYSWD
ncbi:MAG: hypothetical protein JSW54_12175 [Fidelibacterota bacterium]|nr:MAG: hypothetical protein JSW54_12175 [Candidatus Neomarinimicrobiota bacterium]